MLIGITMCMWHEDNSRRKIFNGRPLFFCEKSFIDYFQQGGHQVVLLPPRSDHNYQQLLNMIDRLVLSGGADMSPLTYGETPMKEAYKGDQVRDNYELKVLEQAYKMPLPILGICRGAQVINVFCGGTLYQDISEQLPNSLVHRNAETYDDNNHELIIYEQGFLADIYPDVERTRVNSVHHQGVKDLGSGLQVAAISPEDQVIEAFSHIERPKLWAVQWHPEFNKPSQRQFLDSKPLLDKFLGE